MILIRSDWAVLADDFRVSYAQSFVSRGTRLVTLNRSICSRQIEHVTFRRQCSSLPKFRLAHCHEVLVRLLASHFCNHIQSCSHELPLCSQLAALFLLSSNVTLSLLTQRQRQRKRKRKEKERERETETAGTYTLRDGVTAHKADTMRAWTRWTRVTSQQIAEQHTGIAEFANNG